MLSEFLLITVELILISICFPVIFNFAPSNVLLKCRLLGITKWLTGANVFEINRIKKPKKLELTSFLPPRQLKWPQTRLRSRSRRTRRNWNFRKAMTLIVQHLTTPAQSHLSSEFDNVETLMLSEVHLLLQQRKEQNEQQEELQEFSEVFLKTLNYTQRLSRFKNRETIRAVRQ